MEIMRDYLYYFNFLRRRETNAQHSSIQFRKLRYPKRGLLKNESIACNTQTYHSLFRTSVYVFNEIMEKKKEKKTCAL